MGSGRFVGCFEGYNGIATPSVASDPIQTGSRMAGGFVGWDGAILGVPSAPACQKSGTLIYTTGLLPAEHTISSPSPVPGNVWVEISRLPFLPGPCLYDITATTDAVDIGPPTDDFVIQVFIAPSGAADPTAFDTIPPGLVSNLAANITNVYATYNMGPQTFTGAPGPMSLYVWAPVVGPGFNGSTIKYKNFTATIRAH